MSMFNDIDWIKKDNSKVCLSNSEQVKNHAKRFQRGHRSFVGPGDDEKWYGTDTYKPEGQWNSIAEDMVENLKNLHPVFRSVRAIEDA